MAKATFVRIKFFPDVACQKLLQSANDSRSYSKNKSGTFFMDHSVVVVVVVVCWLLVVSCYCCWTVHVVIWIIVIGMVVDVDMVCLQSPVHLILNFSITCFCWCNVISLVFISWLSEYCDICNMILIVFLFVMCSLLADLSNLLCAHRCMPHCRSCGLACLTFFSLSIWLSFPYGLCNSKTKGCQKLTRKAQLTQWGTRNSSAYLKAESFTVARGRQTTGG